MWSLGGKEIGSRFLLGTSRYPSPEILKGAVEASGTEILTVSIRRENPGSKQGNPFWEWIQSCDVNLLPNTAGCRTVKEAVTTAHLAKEIFDTDWIKLEVIGDEYTLQPDPFGTVEAAKILCDEGFEVFPYMTEDLIFAEKLLGVGCEILMPWGSPIGSGKGIAHPERLQTLRARFREVSLIVDAGIGAPSHAARAMELGMDGVLLNTAVAVSHDPIEMGRAFGEAVIAGRRSFEAGLMPERDHAVPSTPVVGQPFVEGLQ